MGGECGVDLFLVYRISKMLSAGLRVSGKQWQGVLLARRGLAYEIKKVRSHIYILSHACSSIAIYVCIYASVLVCMRFFNAPKPSLLLSPPPPPYSFASCFAQIGVVGLGELFTIRINAQG